MPDQLWMPIETAPQDGLFMAWVPNTYRDDGGFIVSDCYRYQGDLISQGDGIVAPTHWMPLPPPPKGNHP